MMANKCCANCKHWYKNGGECEFIQFTQDTFTCDGWVPI